MRASFIYSIDEHLTRAPTYNDINYSKHVHNGTLVFMASCAPFVVTKKKNNLIHVLFTIHVNNSQLLIHSVAIDTHSVLRYSFFNLFIFSSRANFI